MTFPRIGSMRCGSTCFCEALKTHPRHRIENYRKIDFFCIGRMLNRDFGGDNCGKRLKLLLPLAQGLLREKQRNQ